MLHLLAQAVFGEDLEPAATSEKRAIGAKGREQGCGIKGFLPTSVIQNSRWEALSVVSQKWSFPTALVGNDRVCVLGMNLGAL